MTMFEMAKKKNYLSVNLLIKKGMLKRRAMASSAVLNVTADKSHIKVIK